MTMNDATRAQVDAARPDASTWLSANAGSGKTRVLTDRVARLLLDRVEPQHILCLTYTKAAASEMQNRLFKRLGKWAMQTDDKLRAEMAALGVTRRLEPADLRRARTLFAMAIETPGGLKIQTIHSFCAALLRRFPLEAGVSPQFTEIEDRAADLLRADIVTEMAEGADAHLVQGLATHYTGEDFGLLTRDIVNNRAKFAGPRGIADFLTLFDAPPETTLDRVLDDVFQPGTLDLIETIIPVLETKGGNDGKAAAKLRNVSARTPESLLALESVLLLSKAPFTAKIGKFPTKPSQQVLADHMPALEALMHRVEDARLLRLAIAAAERAFALTNFAQAFLAHYESAKSQRGWLDFDDLILKTRSLLSDRQMAAWVLYRIDGGIDHILVDEAQDTSPDQWVVIERLAEEFHSGSGAQDNANRTLFVVGDKKQSIYSFQGADPLEFDRKSLLFEGQIKGADKPFQHRSLEYSFRSSSAILRFVDTVFDPNRRPAFQSDSKHKAFKDTLPGRVDLWPVVEKAETEEDPHWTDPVDRRSPQHHTVILAQKIADEIKRLTDGEHYIPDDGKEPGTFVRRPIRAGDFLILVRRRSALFSEIIRACKAAGLPIAGADRLKVGAELAVRDLGALLSFLATPDDDLSLATVLKSPLFGWSEQMLFTLAHDRKGRKLWEVLRAQTDLHGATIAILQDLRGQVDFLRPYDLIERILTRHGGRRKLLSRLGTEAEDGINALLTQALAFERNEIPSLTGFIEWMQTDDLEIKRQIDSASDQIRVMTVHGAKGLEAPIVILPDTGQWKNEVRAEILEIDDTAIWKTRADEMPASMHQRTDEMKAAQEQERLRLLYVAMTRAEKWLIIAAAGELSKDGSSWHQVASEAMDHLNGAIIDAQGTRRFEEGGWAAPEILEPEAKDSKNVMLEPLFSTSPRLFCQQAETLSPSDLGGPKALSGEAGQDEAAAMEYGSSVHAYLEALASAPPGSRPAMARRMAARQGNSDALNEADALVSDPAFADLFQPGTLYEVPVTATLQGLRLHGIIDLLQVSDDRIFALDYKTNRVVPERPEHCPEGILRQMGAYAAMLAHIYPDRTIETAILWTATRKMMSLPHNLVTTALQRSPYLDAGKARS